MGHTSSTARGARTPSGARSLTKLIKENHRRPPNKGGGDPNANPRLRLAMDKAAPRACQSDNMENAIKRGTGPLKA